MNEPGTQLSRLEVAVYGLINAGKSSLINALAHQDVLPTSPIGGTTRDVADVDWTTIDAEVGSLDVRLLDTPGLEEVGDDTRSSVATEAARRADLVVFVVAEDLTDSSFHALSALRGVGKPIVVALNKVDLLTPDEEATILAAIRGRLAGMIEPADVIPVAAAPIVRERVTEGEGSRVIARRGDPQVTPLLDRLIAALNESGADLKDLNDARERIEAHTAEREREKAERRGKAERVADETSLALAMALAVNPIPLVDFLTGPGGLVILVTRVAHAYDESPSLEDAKALASVLFKGGRAVLWGSVVAVVAGGAMKFLPGLGHLAGALTQGTAAGYFAHVLGRALVDYHQNGHDWGDGGIVAALDRIAARTDRKAVTRGLVDTLKARLKR
jgi:GTPase